MKFFDRLCGHKKLITELSNQLAKAEADRTFWKTTCEKKQEETTQVSAELRSAKAEIAKVKREQTEADLFFVTAKIQKELLDGKSKDDPGLQNLLHQQSSYQGQLAAMQRLSAISPETFYASNMLKSQGMLGSLFNPW